MTVDSLLAELRKRGVEMVLARDRIRYRPTSKVGPSLLEEMKVHKGQLTKVLAPAIPLSDVLCGVQEVDSSELTREALDHTLGEFQEAGRVYEVFATGLDEIVLIASDNARPEPGLHRVIYRAAELIELAGLKPKDLKAVHDVKMIFGGTVEPS